MNTPSKAYVTKFSSGTILALLALSGMLFLVPIAGTVHAVNPNPLTVTFTAGNPMKGAQAGPCPACAAIGFTLTNPVTNTYAITSFTLTAPSGFTILAAPAWVPATCTVAVGGGSVACTGLNVIPGSNLAVSGSVATPAPGAGLSYPQSYTWTSVVQDASGVGYYVGPSFSTMTMDPTTAVAVTAFSSANFIAGSAALTMTATVTPAGQVGLPIVWTITGALGVALAAGNGCGYTGNLAACPTYTGGVASIGASSTTSGSTTTTATTAFSPSNHATDNAYVTATVGTSAAKGTTAGALTTLAGSPASVVWTQNGAAFGSSKTIYISRTQACAAATPGAICFATPSYAGAVKGAEYEGGGAGGFTVAAADGFGNTYTAGITSPTSGPLITVSSASGVGIFDGGGRGGLTQISSGNACATTDVTCTGGVTATGSGYVNLNYFQTYTYGTTGVLTAAINGMYNSNPFSVSGLSGTILTGTEAIAATSAVSPANAANTAPVVGTQDTYTVTLTASTQPGVPVTMELCIHHSCAVTPAGYGSTAGQGAFSNGAESITVNTAGPTGTGAGAASAKFTVDQTSGVSIDLNATFPVTPLLTGTVTPTLAIDTVSATSKTLVGPTVPGTPSTLQIALYFDHGMVNAIGTSLATGVTPVFVCVNLADQYGNAAINPLSAQISVSLTSTSGSFTTSTPYVAAASVGTCDTAHGSFGVDQWNLPTNLALASTVSITATATLSSSTPAKTTTTLTIVSPSPTISVKPKPAPVGGWIYSNTGAVTFTTSANVSAGLSGAVTIAKLSYKINSNPWAVAATPGANVNTGIVTALFFSLGTSTVEFNATDSTAAPLGNTVVSPSFSVLVDTSAPTITATTAAGASLTNGAPVVFSVVDTEGDLNATAVTANYNGTAVASSAVAITGTNNPGHSVTYTVSVTGIPTGHWSVTLNAKSLAGNAATPVSVLVHIIVPFATSVVVSGTPTKTTIGGFTGISATYTNNWSTSQSLVVFAVWKNSAGQTVAVTTSGLTLAAGASGTAFAPLASPLASGSYTVNVFVWTTNNLSVSSTTPITTTV